MKVRPIHTGAGSPASDLWRLGVSVVRGPNGWYWMFRDDWHSGELPQLFGPYGRQTEAARAGWKWVRRTTRRTLS